MRYILVFLLLIHGIIHFLGFTKAFHIGSSKLTKEISKPVGILWLLDGISFCSAALLIVLHQQEWIWVVFTGAIVSELLIIGSWKDAKFGTVINLILVIVVILNWGSVQFEKSYQKDVQAHLKQTAGVSGDILTEADLKDLPAIIQQYLHYTGMVNKPKIKNIRIVFEGEMRSKSKDYFPFVSEQYNFFDRPAARLFFMKGKMFGITVPGYHKYENAKASMDIRLFGLFSVIKKTGPLMDTTETVTLFNDMCVFAPATLTDNRIQWKTINDTTIKARFTNEGISISAILYFNRQGQMINFLSTDRTEIGDMQRYPFTTPVSDYKEIHGYLLPTKGETVWQYPDGKFTYGRFYLKDIEYNCR